MRLKDHDKHFVKFLGWYANTDNMTFYIMEYIGGGDLHFHMTRNRVKAKEDTKEITRQILEGLVILHEQNICHRDLKPQNILVASVEPIWVKIADFGVAKHLEGTIPRTGHGTDGYRAPEVLGVLPESLRWKPQIGYALDIWSLGAMIYELLTTRAPFFDSGGPGNGSWGMTGVAAGWSSKPRLNYGDLMNFCFGVLEFPTGPLIQSGISQAGIQFVKSLLVPDPQERPEPLGALRSRNLSDWIGGAIGEFLRMGVDLDLRHVQQGGPYVLQCFPVSAREKIPVLLNQALSDGHISATSTLLGIPGGKPISPLTSEIYPKAFDRAIELRKVGLVCHNGGEALRLAATERRWGDPGRKNYRLVLTRSIILGLHKAVELLLKVDVGFRISPKSKDPEGRPDHIFLDFASQVGHTDIVKLLLKAGADVNALANYTDGDERDGVIELLFKAGAKYSASNARALRRTALQAAARGGHIDIVKLLLEAGADVNAPPAGGSGRTALQAAARGGHIDIVKLLLEAGAGVSASAGISGRTALQAAAEDGHIDIVKLLLEAGADVNAPPAGYSGRTALQAAAGGGHIDTAKLLLKAGADVNANEWYIWGITALEAARYSGVPEMVELLLNYPKKIKSTSMRRPR